MNPKDRKDTIIGAATRCFSERGYHSTQISDIIEMADIARGTFYLYFKSKHEIFNFILDDFTSHVGAQIKTIEVGTPESPILQLKKNVERVVDAMLEKPEIAKIIFNEAVGLDQEIDERLKTFYKRLLEIITSSINKGMTLGLIRNISSEITACIVLGGFREIFVQNSIFGNIKATRGTIVDGLISVIIGGISVAGVIPEVGLSSPNALIGDPMDSRLHPRE